MLAISAGWSTNMLTDLQIFILICLTIGLLPILVGLTIGANPWRDIETGQVFFWTGVVSWGASLVAVIVFRLHGY
jgi:hypothetical protein